MTIQVGDKTIETDEEFYMLDLAAWEECVAEAVPVAGGLKLTETQWVLVNYFRTFYADHMRHPTMHELVQALGKHHGKRFEEAKKYREFLYQLFPRGRCRRSASWRACPGRMGGSRIDLTD